MTHRNDFFKKSFSSKLQRNLAFCWICFNSAECLIKRYLTLLLLDLFWVAIRLIFFLTAFKLNIYIRGSKIQPVGYKIIQIYWKSSGIFSIDENTSIKFGITVNITKVTIMKLGTNSLKVLFFWTQTLTSLLLRSKSLLFFLNFLKMKK